MSVACLLAVICAGAAVAVSIYSATMTRRLRRTVDTLSLLRPTVRPATPRPSGRCHDCGMPLDPLATYVWYRTETDPTYICRECFWRARDAKGSPP